MGLLAILITVLIGLFVRLGIGSTKTLDRSMALELAHRILEEHAANSPTTWQIQDQHSETLGVGRPPILFEYRLDSALLSDASNPMGDLYRMDVDVSWWPQGNASSQRRDYGRLTLRLSRVVFVPGRRP